MSPILKVLLIILAIILILILLLSFKLKIEFIYRNKEAQFYIKYLFFRFPLSSEKAEKEKDAEKNQGQKGKRQKKDFFESVSNMLTLVSGAGRIVKTALSLHTAKIFLKAKICSEDAASTAVEVGKTSAFVHSALGVLANFVKIKKRDIVITPDYTGEESDYNLYALVYSRPINLIFNINKFWGDLMLLSSALPNKK